MSSKQAVELYPSFNTGSGFNELLCPRCKSEYLHHIAVSLYTRKREDIETHAIHITLLGGDVGKTQTTFEKDSQLNPSSRRGGVVIDFSCEECGLICGLTFAQHKGCTFVQWTAYKDD